MAINYCTCTKKKLGIKKLKAKKTKNNKKKQQYNDKCTNFTLQQNPHEKHTIKII